MRRGVLYCADVTVRTGNLAAVEHVDSAGAGSTYISLEQVPLRAAPVTVRRAGRAVVRPMTASPRLMAIPATVPVNACGPGWLSTVPLEMMSDPELVAPMTEASTPTIVAPWENSWSGCRRRSPPGIGPARRCLRLACTCRR